MDFKLERDMHSIPKAKRIGLELEPVAETIDIPVFYAEGLEVSISSGVDRHWRPGGWIGFCPEQAEVPTCADLFGTRASRAAASPQGDVY